MEGERQTERGEITYFIANSLRTPPPPRRVSEAGCFTGRAPSALWMPLESTHLESIHCKD